MLLGRKAFTPSLGLKTTLVLVTYIIKQMKHRGHILWLSCITLEVFIQTYEPNKKATVPDLLGSSLVIHSPIGSHANFSNFQPLPKLNLRIQIFYNFRCTPLG
jgi:hypothetical protein